MNLARESIELLEQAARILWFEGTKHGLRDREWMALRFLSRANRFSRTPSALASYVGTTRGTASFIIGELERLGWPPDGRPFRAHLTVARTDAVPHAIGERLAGHLAQRAEVWASAFAADRIVLFESRLGAGPARYAPLHEAGLAD